MGLLDNLHVNKRKTDEDLSPAEVAKASVVRAAFDEVRAKSPALGMMVGSLSDYQLVEISDFVCGLADTIRAGEHVAELTVLPDPPGDSDEVEATSDPYREY